MIRTTLLFLLVSLAGLPNVWSQEKQQDFSDADLEFFEAQVRPLLVKRCFECHGPESEIHEGGLNLASRKSILEGGDTGPGMIVGDAQRSLIIDAINYGDVYEMPPDSKMPAEEIATLTKWVNMGAPWPDEAEVATKKEAFDIQKRKAAHWCWQPIADPTPPIVSDKDWSQDPIDLFVLARLESAGLSPSEVASKRKLIRRLYFDLIGLPPTGKQINEFLADESDQALPKVVDQLLASPAFGERWARHWLDLARYAETCGHEFDYPIPNAFRYRDYLIRAFNADVPYDLFIKEHIAGDLLPTPRRHAEEQYNESIIGTGFWFFGEGHHAPVDVKAEQAKRIDNQIDVMTKSFLGLTVSCARCHDHKFDAISTKDFYAMYGFLKSSRRQDAMLDPGRKIETSQKKIAQLLNDNRGLADQFDNLQNEFDKDTFSRYLTAALTKLRNDPTWTVPKSLIIQGEILHVTHKDDGTLEVQELLPEGERFKWQDNKQIWWVDGEVNSKADLEFQLPMADDHLEFEIHATFTTAFDYGICSVTLNGKEVVKELDCYAPELTTRRVSLGKHKLKPGPQKLGLKITGHNEKAAPRHMLGIDFIELAPVKNDAELEIAETPVPDAAADLDTQKLQALIEGIKSPRLRKPYHPLHLLQKIANGNTQLNKKWVSRMTDQIAKSTEISKTTLSQANVFETFENGLPESWFATGAAFGSDGSQARDNNTLSIAGDLVVAKSQVHSGRFGDVYEGVLRSPAFEITSEKIWYRIKGGPCQIRLIIEGYQLDVYNALLFNGMNIQFAGSEDFVWVEQSRDLKNHLGRMAHIEIIDQKNSHFSIDEIVFSSNRPTDAPATCSAEILGRLGESPDLQTFGRSIAESAFQLISDDVEEGSLLKCWLLKHEIVDVVKRPKSISSTDSAPAFVSTKPSAEFAPLSPKELLQAADEINRDVPKPIYTPAMEDGDGKDEFVFVRGNHKALGQVAKRDFLEALSDRLLEIPKGSGRLQLANKIASFENPLTARVAVNRVWHHLLGRGIVGSVDNFGVLGEKPTHPELLDHLATRFAKEEWSIKKLIRAIVLSKTYQLSSVPNSKAKESDPDNKLLHSANIHRLEGEAIRDSMLAISGQLNSTSFGPSTPIHLTSFMTGRGRPGKSGPLDGKGRRSIYIEVRRNFLSPMMLAFDTPSPFNALGRRNRSNVPAQALILMNDPFVAKQASHWAKRLISEGESAEQRIQSIYVAAFGRLPTSTELADSLSFIASQGESKGLATADVGTNVEIWKDFCHVIFNVKQFIYVD